MARLTSLPERQISVTALLRPLLRQRCQQRAATQKAGRDSAGAAWFERGPPGSCTPMTSGWRRGPRPAGRRWRPRGPLGCLLWLVILVIILLVLSLFFGGFQRGTKAELTQQLPAASVAL
jgi:hypothetical protein